MCSAWRRASSPLLGYRRQQHPPCPLQPPAWPRPTAGAGAPHTLSLASRTCWAGRTFPAVCISCTWPLDGRHEEAVFPPSHPCSTPGAAAVTFLSSTCPPASQQGQLQPLPPLLTQPLTKSGTHPIQQPRCCRIPSFSKCLGHKSTSYLWN